ncbi:MAG TPA: FixH family protein [Kofleriaceae bacterium]|nr:FixH family protein [Kofleriaceae bacterium]
MMARLLVGITTLAACGRSQPSADPHDPCAAEARADHFVDGLRKRGAAGALDFALVSSEPAPPARGDNTWIVQLDAISSGAAGPVDGATIAVTPFMPDHGHGATVKVNVTALPTAGQYRLAPINLWMPGYWETTIRASHGSTSDSAVFKFCIAN